MAKIITCSLLVWIYIFSSIQAQDINRRWAFGGGLAVKDYQSLPVDGSLNPSTFNLAFYAHLGRVLSPSFELQLAGMLPYPNYTYSTAFEPNYQTSLHLFYRLNNGYIIKKDSRLAPYLSAGAMATYQNFQDEDYYLSIPVGLGLRLQPARFVSLFVGGNYHLAAVANRSLPLVSFQGGVSLHFGNSKEKADKNDADGDGIKDKKDDCPYIAGLAAFRGCPDSDLDGVEDKLDKCPEIQGIAANGGCPEGDTDQDGLLPPLDDCPQVYGKIDGCPDSDQDGVIDKLDECPSQKGSLQALGCPDRDGDGIPDKDDKCPDEQGLADYGGCLNDPVDLQAELTILARQINFVPETAELLTTAKDALDKIAGIMEDQEGLFLKISVYTDNQGDKYQRYNLGLKRAETCKNYLSQVGNISQQRFLTLSYGSFLPIADNFTIEGVRANNRVSLAFFLP